MYEYSHLLQMKKTELKEVKYISEDYMHTDLGLIHKQVLSTAAGHSEKSKLAFTVGDFFEPYMSDSFPFHNHFMMSEDWAQGTWMEIHGQNEKEPSEKARQTAKLKAV